jgi:hypothetical protein
MLGELSYVEIQARETSEVIDQVPDAEAPKPAPKAQQFDPAVAAITQNLEAKEKTQDEETQQEDEFMGAWG